MGGSRSNKRLWFYLPRGVGAFPLYVGHVTYENDLPRIGQYIICQIASCQYEEDALAFCGPSVEAGHIDQMKSRVRVSGEGEAQAVRFGSLMYPKEVRLVR